jgi:LysM repeat protein
VKFSVWFNRASIAALLCMSLSGCFPSSQSQFEEEKESHYQEGKSCVSSMDYTGAVEAFEKAVEVNPRSASAHFQLGWLYEEKVQDPAAAIYHYQQYLKLRPDADNAEVVKQHIVNCKQDLAKDVLPLPVAPPMQRQFEQLAEENKKLRDENEKWKAYFASLPKTAPATNPPAQTPVQPVTRSVSNAPTQSVSGNSTRQTVSNNFRSPVPTGRTHVVQQGETAAAIARRYGVKLDDLLKANPGLEPKKMRVGRSINIP